MCFRPPQVGKPIRCPECGMMNQSTATVCKKCKAELPVQEVPMMECPACGFMNRYDTDACDGCGLTVEEMIEQGLVVPDAPEEEKPALGIPGAPKAPGAPGIPMAPQAPKVPAGANIPAAPKGPNA